MERRDAAERRECTGTESDLVLKISKRVHQK